MEIKIGVQNTPRELIIDVDEDSDQIQQLLTDALPDGVFSVTDARVDVSSSQQQASPT